MPYDMKLQDVYKQFTGDQDKALPPDQTLERVKSKLAALDLAILDRAVRIDNGRLDIPVYISYCGPDAARLTGTKKQMGKGATPRQAEASAVMELVERFSFFSFADRADNFITAPYPQVKDRALSFELIARSVHDESDELDVTRQVFEALPLKWAWGYDLTSQRPVQVPFDWFYTINEFNGPSAGNCPEEAILQGICEVVERHTSARVSHEGIRTAAIDPASVTHPQVRELMTKYANAGVRIFISDFTLDTGIPNIGVLAYDPATFPEKSEIVWTAGTTPDPQKALSRALTETAQLGGDFNTGANYVASGLPKFRHLAEAEYVTRPERTIGIDALPDLSNDNIKTEIDNCLSALARIDMPVIVIDTQHPELQVPAFYTIIPGAHFRERALGTSVGMFSAKMLLDALPLQQALSRLHELDARLPHKYYVHFYIGLAHYHRNDFEAAISAFQKALDCHPPEPDIASIYSYLGQCFKHLEDYPQALALAEKGIEHDAERTDLHNLTGFCRFKLKQHEAAVESFKKVLQIDPSSAIDYANIATNYREMGNTEKAIQYYMMALELDPTIEFAVDNLTKLQRQIKSAKS